MLDRVTTHRELRERPTTNDVGFTVRELHRRAWITIARKIVVYRDPSICNSDGRNPERGITVSTAVGISMASYTSGVRAGYEV